MREKKCRFCNKDRRGKSKTWCCRERYIEETVDKTRYKKTTQR